MAESDNRLWQLHLRKAQGEDLTSQEDADLAAWYAEQDQAEALALGIAENVDTSDSLTYQIDAILERIITTSQTIQAISAENEALRHENTTLRLFSRWNAIGSWQQFWSS